jgi:hypothetical protein
MNSCFFFAVTDVSRLAGNTNKVKKIPFRRDCDAMKFVLFFFDS